MLNILEYIGKIAKYTEETNDAEELFELNDQMNLNATLTLLTNIGENASKITEKLKQEYSHIEWHHIKNFRNRIVHNYAGIDLAIVYEVITNNLKILKPDLEKIIKEQANLKIFDFEEIKMCKESNFYKHIDFEKIM